MKSQIIKTGLKAGKETSNPIVGKGATILAWTDRYAYEVLSVSDCGKKVVIAPYVVKHAQCNVFTESQKYIYDEVSKKHENIIFKNGTWKRIIETVELIDNSKSFEERSEFFRLNPHIINRYGGLNLVDGITKIKKQYNKISILFGHKEEYRDPSF